MNEKLGEYINSLFADAPMTRNNLELKEEILQNTVDRYNDLIAEGKTEQSAYNLAISGIGDVQELIERPIVHTQNELYADRKRSAVLLSVSVMLYIMSVIPPILLSCTRFADTLGPVFMFIMIAVATGLIIYRAKTKLPTGSTEDTVVENFKEWNQKKEDNKSLYKSINGALWAIILVLYFVISFATMKWYITWLIFLIGAALSNILDACLQHRK